MFFLIYSIPLESSYFLFILTQVNLKTFHSQWKHLLESKKIKHVLHVTTRNFSPQEILTDLIYLECPCQLPSTRNLHYSIQDNFEWLSNGTPFNLLQLGYASPGPQNIKGRKAGVLRIMVLIA